MKLAGEDTCPPHDYVAMGANSASHTTISDKGGTITTTVWSYLFFCKKCGEYFYPEEK